MGEAASGAGEFEARLLEFFVATIARQGSAESGAYGFYEERFVRQRTLFLWHEIQVLRRLTALAAAKPIAVVHPGAGFCPLSLSLAARGIPTVAIEQDRRRCASAIAARDALAADFPVAARNCDIRQGGYPDTPGIDALPADRARGLIFTNMAVRWTPAAEDAILATFPRFDFVLLDLGRFGPLRDLDAERRDLERRIRALGATGGERLALARVNEYWEFRFAAR